MTGRGVWRAAVIALGALLTAGFGPVGTALADGGECNDAYCTPGITAGVELGAPCDNTGYFVFGVDTRNDWGRLVFCGSPRRLAPRYFRSPPMVGVKELNTSCEGYERDVAQAPDGLFLTCGSQNAARVWVRGDA